MTEELDKTYVESRTRKLPILKIEDLSDETNNLILEELEGKLTDDMRDKYKKEIKLLDNIRDQVEVNLSYLKKKNTMRNELRMLGKFTDYEVKANYTLEEDIHNNTIPFYHWNDGLNYNQICSKLLSVLSSQNGPIIVSSGLFGGLGHKTLSIYHAILYALILKRPLFCRNSIIHSINQSIIHSFIHSITQSFNHLKIYHSIIRSFDHSIIRSFDHSIIHL